MRIAHVVDTMNMGGAERLVSVMARMQREQGHDPSVHCIFDVGVLGEELRQEGICVSLEGPCGLVRAVQRFSNLFRRTRPHVVHCHNPTAGIYAAAAARMAGVPVVLTTRHGLVKPPYRRIQEFKFAVAARFCDWVVGVCDETVRNLAGVPFARKSNLIRVYNGAVPLRQHKGAAPESNGFTLLHVGRLVPIKNQHMLIEAFAGARRRVPNLALWIVGDGPIKADLEKHAADLGVGKNVTFFGEQSDVAPFFQGADAFAMCSFSEGLPIALLEAMSVGLPAIVTDVGGMAEVVRLAGCGIVCSRDGAEPLARAMVEMSQDRNAAESYSRAGRTCFDRMFTIDAMVREYFRLYGVKDYKGSKLDLNLHEDPESQCCVHHSD